MFSQPHRSPGLPERRAELCPLALTVYERLYTVNCFPVKRGKMSNTAHQVRRGSRSIPARAEKEGEVRREQTAAAWEQQNKPPARVVLVRILRPPDPSIALNLS